MKIIKTINDVVSNFLLIAVVAVVGVLAFAFNTSKFITTANSEYNGTIYAGDRSSKSVSLMVNVCWGTEYVIKILDILEKYNAKVTFFVGGDWAKENGELLKKMYSQGHEIANHGTSHKEHGKISYSENLKEIETCHQIVKNILSIDMELFAPPGGSYSKDTIKASEGLGYKTIMWTRDTIDWRDKDANLIFDRATIKMSGGDLVLMHPTACTVDAFERIILHIKNKGLNVTTVSQTLGL